MSNRKPKPEPPAPGTVRSYTIKIMCTDRAQHPAIVLHHISDRRGLSGEQPLMAVEDGRNGSPLVTADDGSRHVRFRCPRCKRNPHYREETFLRMLDVLALDASEGHPVIDISVLP